VCVCVCVCVLQFLSHKDAASVVETHSHQNDVDHASAGFTCSDTSSTITGV